MCSSPTTAAPFLVIPSTPTSRKQYQHDSTAPSFRQQYVNSTPCVTVVLDKEDITYSNRYLMIATSGGLNQQGTRITDVVIAARILNATLVVLQLDQKSFWKDASKFSEIFNVDWFISSLSKDVKIIKQLPIKGGKAFDTPYTMRVPRKHALQSAIKIVSCTSAKAWLCQACLWRKGISCTCF